MVFFICSDIAATEVESQQVATSSDPLPSTINAEDLGKLGLIHVHYSL